MDSNADESVIKDFIGCLIALLAGTFDCLVNISIRKLTSSGLHYSIISFYYALGNLILCPICSIISQNTEDDQIPNYSYSLVLMIIIIGTLFQMNGSFYTYSTNFINPSTLSIFLYLNIVISYFADIIFFNT